MRGDPGVMGAGSLQEAGEDRVGDGIPKGGVSREKLGNILQQCAIFEMVKAHRGRNHYGGGREPRFHGTGSWKFNHALTPCPPLNMLYTIKQLTRKKKRYHVKTGIHIHFLSNSSAGQVSLMIHLSRQNLGCPDVIC